MPSPSTDVDLLRRLDRYLDAVPRTAARGEAIGPFTLFVNDGPGWKYYARPTPGAGSVSAADVNDVVERQAELGLPRAFEWVVDLVPSMAGAAEGAGLTVALHPLMHLRVERFEAAAPPAGFDVRLVVPDDDLAAVQAVGGVAFGSAGTEPGSAGPAEVRDAARHVPANVLRFVQDRFDRGYTVTAAAFAKGIPIAIGSHQPLDGATEIVGVGTTPAFRRRGLGRALTSLLIEDAMARGVTTIFLSAGDEAIARVYAKLGFDIIGTAGAAEPPEA